MREIVLVDAAHLYMGAQDVLGFNDVSFDRSQLLEVVKSELSHRGVNIWRLYWIDAPLRPERASEVTCLAEADDVHVVLGTRNSLGKQKGVDAQTIRILTEIADWAGETRVHLIAGDDDYIPATSLAASKGLHITLWSLAGSHSVTAELRQSVDRHRTLPTAVFESAFYPTQVNDLGNAGVTVVAEAARAYGFELGQETSPDQIAHWQRESPRIPSEHYPKVAAAVALRQGRLSAFYAFPPEEVPAAQTGFWDGITNGRAHAERFDRRCAFGDLAECSQLHQPCVCGLRTT